MSRKTNTEFVTELMEFSQTGPLMQVFVMTAIQRYAEAAINKKLPNDGLIPPKAWDACAQEVLEKLNEQYGAAK